MPDIVIIGAGISGLALASKLKGAAVILEQGTRAGGLCSSVSSGGYTFDHSGHFLHVRDRAVLADITAKLGRNLARVERNAWIRDAGVYVPFPYQANLHALPPKERRVCLEAARRRPDCGGETPDFLAWSLCNFGSGITSRFMRPYNEKLWTVPAASLTTEWTGPFVPRPTIEEIEQGAVQPHSKRYGYNAEFRYPKRGGCQAIVDAFALAAPQAYFNQRVTSVDLKRRRVTTDSDTTFDFRRLVSTMPLPELLSCITDLPPKIRLAARKLKWNSVMCVNLGIRRSGSALFAGGRHWIYFPEKRYPFYRVGFYSNIAPSMAPVNCGSLYAEISSRPGELPDPRKCAASVERNLRKLGILGRGDLVQETVCLPMPFAYVIFDKSRGAALETIIPWLEKRGVSLLGRYGAWEYSFMERSIIDAASLATRLNGGK